MITSDMDWAILSKLSRIMPTTLCESTAVRPPRTSWPEILGFDHGCVRGKAEVLIAPMYRVLTPIEVIVLGMDHAPW